MSLSTDVITQAIAAGLQTARFSALEPLLVGVRSDHFETMQKFDWHHDNWLLIYLLATAQLEAVDQLLAAGVNIHVQHYTILTNCVLKNQLKVVKYLHSKGFDLTASDYTLFGSAVEYDCVEMVRYVVEVKMPSQAQLDYALTRATVHCRCTPDQRTSYSDRAAPMAMIKLLLSLGADINTNDGECLTNAAARYADEPFNFMLEHCKPSNYGKAISKAAAWGCVSHMKVLLAKGEVDFECIMSAMCNAAAQGQGEALKLLATKCTREQVKASPYFRNFGNACRQYKIDVDKLWA